jgi:hypothetical protein
VTESVTHWGEYRVNGEVESMPTVTGQAKATRKLAPFVLAFGDLPYARKNGEVVDRDGKKVRIRSLRQVISENRSRGSEKSK